MLSTFIRYGRAIQRQIEPEHVHPGLSQEAQVRPSVRALIFPITTCLAQIPGLRHARRLKLGITQADVRVQAAAGGGHGVGGNRVAGGRLFSVR